MGNIKEMSGKARGRKFKFCTCEPFILGDGRVHLYRDIVQDYKFKYCPWCSKPLEVAYGKNTDNKKSQKDTD